MIDKNELNEVQNSAEKVLGLTQYIDSIVSMCRIISTEI